MAREIAAGMEDIHDDDLVRSIQKHKEMFPCPYEPQVFDITVDDEDLFDPAKQHFKVVKLKTKKRPDSAAKFFSKQQIEKIESQKALNHVLTF